jgi:hypothetical protein
MRDAEILKLIEARIREGHYRNPNLTYGHIVMAISIQDYNLISSHPKRCRALQRFGYISTNTLMRKWWYSPCICGLLEILDMVIDYGILYLDTPI